MEEDNPDTESDSDSSSGHAAPDTQAFENDEIFPPIDSPSSPDLSSDATTTKKRRPAVTMEEIEDEEHCLSGRGFIHIENFPEQREAGETRGTCTTSFSRLRQQQEGEGLSPSAPFEDTDEWELVRWLMTAGVSQGKIDSYLKLRKVRRDSYTCG